MDTLIDWLDDLLDRAQLAANRLRAWIALQQHLRAARAIKTEINGLGATMHRRIVYRDHGRIIHLRKLH